MPMREGLSCQRDHPVVLGICPCHELSFLQVTRSPLRVSIHASLPLLRRRKHLDAVDQHLLTPLAKPFRSCSSSEFASVQSSSPLQDHRLRADPLVSRLCGPAAADLDRSCRSPQVDYDRLSSANIRVRELSALECTCGCRFQNDSAGVRVCQRSQTAHPSWIGSCICWMNRLPPQASFLWQTPLIHSVLAVSFSQRRCSAMESRIARVWFAAPAVPFPLSGRKMVGE
jgi:hypothetical protein